jgi:hypothetical protein
MKVRTDALEASALDWAVAQAAGYRDVLVTDFDDAGQPEECFFRPAKLDPSGAEICGSGETWSPSSRWDQGGPIIEREEIDVACCGAAGWSATGFRTTRFGASPLVAAMRCFVASRLGAEIEVPDQLVKSRLPRPKP